MKYLIHCKNSECKNYHEDICYFLGTMIVLNENGKCENFKAGKNPAYEIDIKLEGYEKIFEKYGLKLDLKTMDYSYINKTWKLGNIKKIENNFVIYKKRYERKIITTSLDNFLKEEGTK